MKRSVLVVLVAVVGGVMALGAIKEGPLPAEVQEVIKGFFERLQQGQVDEAYDWLGEAGRFGSRAPLLEQMKAQTKAAFALYGTFTGMETVHETRATPSLVQGLYLYKMSDFALMWEFTFYKSSQGWRVAAVVFNDQLHTWIRQGPASR